jgi:cytochrome c553
MRHPPTLQSQLFFEADDTEVRKTSTHCRLPMTRYCAVTTLTLLLCAALAAPTAAAQATAPAAPNAAAAAPAPAFKGDAVKGRDLTRMCEGCHGVQGWRTAYPEVYHVPKLGGQHAPYIVAALHAYKNGDRTHPSMRAIAASLSDEDMANLAAYYATGSPQATTASK